MDSSTWALFGTYAFILLVGGYALARYLYWVYEKPEPGRVERVFYRAMKIDAQTSMTGWLYAKSVLAFSVVGVALLVAIQRLQGILPLNPDHLGPVAWDLALNTAVSFVTNTNWQAYSGEATLSHLTQMVGLGTQNFVSAGAGMAVAVALARGFRNRESSHLGNFWKDLTRGVLYVLVPLSLVLALVLVGEGVVQNFHATSDGIPGGPAASQIAIKQLGTNGGGLFGVNSAHPFENPTPLSNFLQLLSILIIPAAFPFFFGRMIGRRKEGWLLFAVMGGVFALSLAGSYWAESQINPLTSLPYLEGKEMRFTQAESVLWGSATTVASNGSVNSMHDSYSPIAGGLFLFNIMLGEVIFGGVGSGLYGMALFAILTVFLSGLMVGRTPEYLGKKIESREIILSGVGALLPGLTILLGTALAVVTEAGLKAVSNPGPHGLTQILYAMTSAAGNNGSAFAGLGVNSPFYNLTLSALMWVGRFGVIVPVLLLADSVGRKKLIAASPGTLPTASPLFGALLVAVILLVGGLTFFPALMLGPVLEHGAMLRGIGF